MKNINDTMPRIFAKSGPTVDSFRQNGHRASVFVSVLNINDSEQWPHITRHMPGDVWDICDTEAFPAAPGTRPILPVELCPPSESPVSVRLMTRLQFCRGQAIRPAAALHINKQLQGHRTYFFPGGGSRIGC